MTARFLCALFLASSRSRWLRSNPRPDRQETRNTTHGDPHRMRRKRSDTELVPSRTGERQKCAVSSSSINKCLGEAREIAGVPGSTRLRGQGRSVADAKRRWWAGAIDPAKAAVRRSRAAVLPARATSTCRR